MQTTLPQPYHFRQKGIASIVGLLALVLLVVIIPLTVELVRQRQEIRKLAYPGAGCTDDSQCNGLYEKCINGQCVDQGLPPQTQPPQTSTPQAFCGDNACNGSESCTSCPTDCGSCPTPAPGETPAPTETAAPVPGYVPPTRTPAPPQGPMPEGYEDWRCPGPNCDKCGVMGWWGPDCGDFCSEHPGDASCEKGAVTGGSLTRCGDGVCGGDENCTTCSQDCSCRNLKVWQVTLSEQEQIAQEQAEKNCLSITTISDKADCVGVQKQKILEEITNLKEMYVQLDIESQNICVGRDDQDQCLKQTKEQLQNNWAMREVIAEKAEEKCSDTFKSDNAKQSWQNCVDLTKRELWVSNIDDEKQRQIVQQKNAELVCSQALGSGAEKICTNNLLAKIGNGLDIDPVAGTTYLSPTWVKLNTSCRNQNYVNDDNEYYSCESGERVSISSELKDVCKSSQGLVNYDSCLKYNAQAEQNCSSFNQESLSLTNDCVKQNLIDTRKSLDTERIRQQTQKTIAEDICSSYPGVDANERKWVNCLDRYDKIISDGFNLDPQTKQKYLPPEIIKKTGCTGVQNFSDDPASYYNCDTGQREKVDLATFDLCQGPAGLIPHSMCESRVSEVNKRCGEGTENTQGGQDCRNSVMPQLKAEIDQEQARLERELAKRGEYCAFGNGRGMGIASCLADAAEKITDYGLSFETDGTGSLTGNLYLEPAKALSACSDKNSAAVVDGFGNWYDCSGGGRITEDDAMKKMGQSTAQELTYNQIAENILKSPQFLQAVANKDLGATTFKTAEGNVISIQIGFGETGSDGYEMAMDGRIIAKGKISDIQSEFDAAQKKVDEVKKAGFDPKLLATVNNDMFKKVLELPKESQFIPENISLWETLTDEEKASWKEKYIDLMGKTSMAEDVYNRVTLGMAEREVADYYYQTTYSPVTIANVQTNIDSVKRAYEETAKSCGISVDSWKGNEACQEKFDALVVGEFFSNKDAVRHAVINAGAMLGATTTVLLLAPEPTFATKALAAFTGLLASIPMSMKEFDQQTAAKSIMDYKYGKGILHVDDAGSDTSAFDLAQKANLSTFGWSQQQTDAYFLAYASALRSPWLDENVRSKMLESGPESITDINEQQKIIKEMNEKPLSGQSVPKIENWDDIVKLNQLRTGLVDYQNAVLDTSGGYQAYLQRRDETNQAVVTNAIFTGLFEGGGYVFSRLGSAVEKRTVGIISDNLAKDNWKLMLAQKGGSAELALKLGTDMQTKVLLESGEYVTRDQAAGNLSKIVGVITQKELSLVEDIGKVASQRAGGTIDLGRFLNGGSLVDINRLNPGLNLKIGKYTILKPGGETAAEKVSIAEIRTILSQPELSPLKFEALRPSLKAANKLGVTEEDFLNVEGKISATIKTAINNKGTAENVENFSDTILRRELKSLYGKDATDEQVSVWKDALLVKDRVAGKTPVTELTQTKIVATSSKGQLMLTSGLEEQVVSKPQIIQALDRAVEVTDNSNMKTVSEAADNALKAIQDTISGRAPKEIVASPVVELPPQFKKISSVPKALADIAPDGCSSCPLIVYSFNLRIGDVDNLIEMGDREGAAKVLQTLKAGLNDHPFFNKACWTAMNAAIETREVILVTNTAMVDQAVAANNAAAEEIRIQLAAGNVSQELQPEVRQFQETLIAKGKEAESLKPNVPQANPLQKTQILLTEVNYDVRREAGGVRDNLAKVFQGQTKPQTAVQPTKYSQLEKLWPFGEKARLEKEVAQEVASGKIKATGQQLDDLIASSLEQKGYRAGDIEKAIQNIKDAAKVQETKPPLPETLVDPESIHQASQKGFVTSPQTLDNVTNVRPGNTISGLTDEGKIFNIPNTNVGGDALTNIGISQELIFSLQQADNRFGSLFPPIKEMGKVTLDETGKLVSGQSASMVLLPRDNIGRPAVIVDNISGLTSNQLYQPAGLDDLLKGKSLVEPTAVTTDALQNLRKISSLAQAADTLASKGLSLADVNDSIRWQVNGQGQITGITILNFDNLMGVRYEGQPISTRDSSIIANSLIQNSDALPSNTIINFNVQPLVGTTVDSPALNTLFYIDSRLRLEGLPKDLRLQLLDPYPDLVMTPAQIKEMVDNALRILEAGGTPEMSMSLANYIDLIKRIQAAKLPGKQKVAYFWDERGKIPVVIEVGMALTPGKQVGIVKELIALFFGDESGIVKVLGRGEEIILRPDERTARQVIENVWWLREIRNGIKNGLHNTVVFWDEYTAVARRTHILPSDPVSDFREAWRNTIERLSGKESNNLVKVDGEKLIADLPKIPVNSDNFIHVMGSTYSDVYRGFAEINGQTKEVIAVIFKHPTGKEMTWQEKIAAFKDEFEKADLLSRSGFGPHLYGTVDNKNGQLGYILDIPKGNNLFNVVSSSKIKGTSNPINDKIIRDLNKIREILMDNGFVPPGNHWDYIITDSGNVIIRFPTDIMFDLSQINSWTLNEALSSFDKDVLKYAIENKSKEGLIEKTAKGIKSLVYGEKKGLLEIKVGSQNVEIIDNRKSGNNITLPTSPKLLKDIQNIVRGKYGLPPIELREFSPALYEEKLLDIAKREGVNVSSKTDFMRFFNEYKLASAVFDGETNTIFYDTTGEPRVRANNLEHELIHALQEKKYQSMPIEIMEAEAYISGRGSLTVIDDPDLADGLVKSINGSVNVYKKEKGIKFSSVESGPLADLVDRVPGARRIFDGIYNIIEKYRSNQFANLNSLGNFEPPEAPLTKSTVELPPSPKYQLNIFQKTAINIANVWRDLTLWQNEIPELIKPMGINPEFLPGGIEEAKKALATFWFERGPNRFGGTPLEPAVFLGQSETINDVRNYAESLGFTSSQINQFQNSASTIAKEIPRNIAEFDLAKLSPPAKDTLTKMNLDFQANLTGNTEQNTARIMRFFIDQSKTYKTIFGSEIVANTGEEYTLGQLVRIALREEVKYLTGVDSAVISDTFFEEGRTVFVKDMKATAQMLGVDTTNITNAGKLGIHLREPNLMIFESDILDKVEAGDVLAMLLHEHGHGTRALASTELHAKLGDLGSAVEEGANTYLVASVFNLIGLDGNQIVVNRAPQMYAEAAKTIENLKGKLSYLGEDRSEYLFREFLRGNNKDFIKALGNGDLEAGWQVLKEAFTGISKKYNLKETNEMLIEVEDSSRALENLSTGVKTEALYQMTISSNKVDPMLNASVIFWRFKFMPAAGVLNTEGRLFYNGATEKVAAKEVTRAAGQILEAVKTDKAFKGEISAIFTYDSSLRVWQIEGDRDGVIKLINTLKINSAGNDIINVIINENGQKKMAAGNFNNILDQINRKIPEPKKESGLEDAINKGKDDLGQFLFDHMPGVQKFAGSGEPVKIPADKILTEQETRLREASKLKISLDRGKITRANYEGELSKLSFTDENGTLRKINPDTLKWETEAPNLPPPEILAPPETLTQPTQQKVAPANPDKGITARWAWLENAKIPKPLEDLLLRTGESDILTGVREGAGLLLTGPIRPVEELAVLLEKGFGERMGLVKQGGIPFDVQENILKNGGSGTIETLSSGNYAVQGGNGISIFDSDGRFISNAGSQDIAEAQQISGGIKYQPGQKGPGGLPRTPEGPLQTIINTPGLIGFNFPSGFGGGVWDWNSLQTGFAEMPATLEEVLGNIWPGGQKPKPTLPEAKLPPGPKTPGEKLPDIVNALAKNPQTLKLNKNELRTAVADSLHNNFTQEELSQLQNYSGSNDFDELTDSVVQSVNQVKPVRMPDPINPGPIKAPGKFDDYVLTAKAREAKSIPAERDLGSLKDIGGRTGMNYVFTDEKGNILRISRNTYSQHVDEFGDNFALLAALQIADSRVAKIFPEVKGLGLISPLEMQKITQAGAGTEGSQDRGLIVRGVKAEPIKANVSHTPLEGDNILGILENVSEGYQTINQVRGFNPHGFSALTRELDIGQVDLKQINEEALQNLRAIREALRAINILYENGYSINDVKDAFRLHLDKAGKVDGIKILDFDLLKRLPINRKVAQKRALRVLSWGDGHGDMFLSEWYTDPSIPGVGVRTVSKTESNYYGSGFVNHILSNIGDNDIDTPAFNALMDFDIRFKQGGLSIDDLYNLVDQAIKNIEQGREPRYGLTLEEYAKALSKMDHDLTLPREASLTAPRDESDNGVIVNIGELVRQTYAKSMKEGTNLNEVVSRLTYYQNTAAEIMRQSGAFPDDLIWLFDNFFTGRKVYKLVPKMIESKTSYITQDYLAARSGLAQPILEQTNVDELTQFAKNLLSEADKGGWGDEIPQQIRDLAEGKWAITVVRTEEPTIVESMIENAQELGQKTQGLIQGLGDNLGKKTGLVKEEVPETPVKWPEAISPQPVEQGIKLDSQQISQTAGNAYIYSPKSYEQVLKIGGGYGNTIALDKKTGQVLRISNPEVGQEVLDSYAHAQERIYYLRQIDPTLASAFPETFNLGRMTANDISKINDKKNSVVTVLPRKEKGVPAVVMEYIGKENGYFESRQLYKDQGVDDLFNGSRRVNAGIIAEESLQNLRKVKTIADVAQALADHDLALSDVKDAVAWKVDKDGKIIGVKIFDTDHMAGTQYTVRDWNPKDAAETERGLISDIDALPHWTMNAGKVIYVPNIDSPALGALLDIDLRLYLQRLPEEVKVRLGLDTDLVLGPKDIEKLASEAIFAIEAGKAPQYTISLEDYVKAIAKASQEKAKYEAEEQAKIIIPRYGQANAVQLSPDSGMRNLMTQGYVDMASPDTLGSLANSIGINSTDTIRLMKDTQFPDDVGWFATNLYTGRNIQDYFPYKLTKKSWEMTTEERREYEREYYNLVEDYLMARAQGLGPLLKQGNVDELTQFAKNLVNAADKEGWGGEVPQEIRDLASGEWVIPVVGASESEARQGGIGLASGFDILGWAQLGLQKIGRNDLAQKVANIRNVGGEEGLLKSLFDRLGNSPAPKPISQKEIKKARDWINREYLFPRARDEEKALQTAIEKAQLIREDINNKTIAPAEEHNLMGLKAYLQRPWGLPLQNVKDLSDSDLIITSFLFETFQSRVSESIRLNTVQREQELSGRLDQLMKKYGIETNYKAKSVLLIDGDLIKNFGGKHAGGLSFYTAINPLAGDSEWNARARVHEKFHSDQTGFYNPFFLGPRTFTEIMTEWASNIDLILDNPNALKGELVLLKAVNNKYWEGSLVFNEAVNELVGYYASRYGKDSVDARQAFRLALLSARYGQLDNIRSPEFWGPGIRAEYDSIFGKEAFNKKLAKFTDFRVTAGDNSFNRFISKLLDRSSESEAGRARVDYALFLGGAGVGIKLIDRWCEDPNHKYELVCEVDYRIRSLISQTPLPAWLIQPVGNSEVEQKYKIKFYNFDREGRKEEIELIDKTLSMLPSTLYDNLDITFAQSGLVGMSNKYAKRAIVGELMTDKLSYEIRIKGNWDLLNNPDDRKVFPLALIHELVHRKGAGHRLSSSPVFLEFLKQINLDYSYKDGDYLLTKESTEKIKEISPIVASTRDGNEYLYTQAFYENLPVEELFAGFSEGYVYDGPGLKKLSPGIYEYIRWAIFDGKEYLTN